MAQLGHNQPNDKGREKAERHCAHGIYEVPLEELFQKGTDVVSCYFFHILHLLYLFSHQTSGSAAHVDKKIAAVRRGAALESQYLFPNPQTAISSSISDIVGQSNHTASPAVWQCPI